MNMTETVKPTETAAQREARWREEDREAARTPDPEVAAEFERDAAAQEAEDLARAESERPARIEALLLRIANALEGRAR
jgi:hypothetical protein